MAPPGDIKKCRTAHNSVQQLSTLPYEKQITQIIFNKISRHRGKTLAKNTVRLFTTISVGIGKTLVNNTDYLQKD